MINLKALGTTALGAILLTGWMQKSTEAALIPFDITFTDTSGSIFSGSFKAPEEDLAAQNEFISVFDFTATINDITYASGNPASATNPFTALASYDSLSDDLVGISTPFIGVPGLPSVFNLIMFRSGDWAVNGGCVPLPSCSPGFNSGVYQIARSVSVQVPEPSMLLLTVGTGVFLLGGELNKKKKKKDK